jgi:hypothetical protein
VTTEGAPIDLRALQTATDVGALVQTAFERIRARDFDGARPVVERALEVAPHSGMTAHVRLHLNTDSCAVEEGATFGEAFLAGHDPFQGINIHNAWHVAALLLEAGRPSAAIGWHQRVVAPSVRDAPMTFQSATTLLWRLELYGHGRRRGAVLPWDQLRVAGTALDEAKREPNEESADLDDIARAMTFIATGDDESFGLLMDRLHAADPSTRPKAGIVAPVIMGLRASWQGDHGGTVQAMEPVAASIEALSPYPEHRTPLQDTLLDARLNSGRFAAAEALLRRRLASQPRPLPRDLFWLGRALHGQGRQDEAIVPLRAAHERWKDAETDSPELGAVASLMVA